MAKLSIAKDMMEYIKPALLQRCEIEDNRHLNSRERWFYTFKAIVCILSCRWSDKTHYDAIAVAELGCGWYPSAEYDVHWWENLYVGYGLKKWHVSIDEESAP